jgi:prevent-host-death family protein
MIVKSISAAKAQLSALIERVQSGEEIVIGKAGKPVAVLSKYDSGARPRVSGALKGKIRIAPDFDDLPEDLALAFGVAEPGASYDTNAVGSEGA